MVKPSPADFVQAVDICRCTRGRAFSTANPILGRAQAVVVGLHTKHCSEQTLCCGRVYGTGLSTCEAGAKKAGHWCVIWASARNVRLMARLAFTPACRLSKFSRRRAEQSYAEISVLLLEEWSLRQLCAVTLYAFGLGGFIRKARADSTAAGASDNNGDYRDSPSIRKHVHMGEQNVLRRHGGSLSHGVVRTRCTCPAKTAVIFCAKGDNIRGLL